MIDMIDSWAYLSIFSIFYDMLLKLHSINYAMNNFIYICLFVSFIIYIKYDNVYKSTNFLRYFLNCILKCITNSKLKVL